MVSGQPPLAQMAISAPIRLLKANQILMARNLIVDKFGDELLRQMQHSQKSSQQNMLIHQATRPSTFIPGAGEFATSQSASSATSRRESKRKRSSESSGRSAPTAPGKK